MTLDKIKTETTWNDASASINSNFAKILQALGGSIPEGVDSTLIRTLYASDESAGEPPITEEQKAYNAETYAMFADGLTPMIVFQGMGGYGAFYDNEDYGFVQIIFRLNMGFLAELEMYLNEDGSVEVVNQRLGFALAELSDPIHAQMFFENYQVFTEMKGVFLISSNASGVAFAEVDFVSSENGLLYVEYNLHDKRFRVEFNSDYTIKGGVEITPAGGGGSIDPELLEGYLPMMRDFSDDFNNDFSR